MNRTRRVVLTFVLSVGLVLVLNTFAQPRGYYRFTSEGCGEDSSWPVSPWPAS